jgi:DNA (cytosine-5)-methyltransferase 1
MKSNKTLRFIDLFSGMGGFRLGFEQSCRENGFQSVCVLSSEIKESAVKVYKSNFGDECLNGDIFKIKEKDIPKFDYLLAGFPCQAFSSAGKRLGFTDTRGTLFFEIERILHHHKPRGFILENVEGLIRHDSQSKNEKIGKTLTVILKTLRGMGYKVTWRLLDSSKFGVAQARKRVFIVGTRNTHVSLENFTQQNKTLKEVLQKGLKTLNSDIAHKLLEHFNPRELYGLSVKDKRGGNNNIHSWDINLKGPVDEQQKKLLEDIIRNRRNKKWATEKGIKWMDGMPLTIKEISTFSSINPKKIKSLLDDLVEKGYLSYEHPKDIVKHKNSEGKTITGRKPREDVEKGYNIVAGKLSFGISRILDPNGLCPTIVATDVERLAVVDTGGLRRLSTKELLRLSGFPDDFKLPISKLEIYDLLGNTVVVPVVKSISDRVLDIVEKRKLTWATENDTNTVAEQQSLNFE